MNRSNFQARYNNATTGLFRTGQNRGIGSDDMRVLITDIAQNVSWDYGHRSYYNVLDYGVTGDGETEEQAVLTDLIASVPAESVIFFPHGTYVIDSTVEVDKKLSFVGSGATINLTGDEEAFLVTVPNCSFNHLRFTGTGKDEGSLNQYALYFDNGGQYRILDCEFTTLAGGGVIYTNTGSSGNIGGSIVGSLFYNNNFGVSTSTDGEYVSMMSCNVVNNNTGIRLAGGNNTINACNINYNHIGITVESGSNNGHGIISNCNINHNTDYAIKIFDTVNGYTISGCHIYDSDIWLKNSVGVSFDGGIMDVEAYYFENSVSTVFRNVKFSDSYAQYVLNNHNSTTSETSWINCMHLDGRRATDAITFLNGNLSADGFVSSTGARYWGDSEADGSWRQIRSGNNLLTQRRESGSWVTKNTITP